MVHAGEVIKMNVEAQQSEVVVINQISKAELAKVVSELIRELACASSYLKMQI